MAIHRLQCEQLLPIPLTEAFEFFSNPNNLTSITPEWLDFKILDELPEKVYAGLIIRYKIKVIPMLPMTWVTEITQVRDQSYFVDEQRFGPYKFWHHQHIFEPVDNGTLIKDIVHYAMPFWLAGELVHEFKIKHQLNEIFSFRHQMLTQKFGIIEINI